MQWNRGAAICDAPGGGLGLAGFGVPELRGFAGNAEGCVDDLVSIIAVIQKVDVAAREPSRLLDRQHSPNVVDSVDCFRHWARIGSQDVSFIAFEPYRVEE
jgi:hypothetical protein